MLTLALSSKHHPATGKSTDSGILYKKEMVLNKKLWSKLKFFLLEYLKVICQYFN